VLAEAERAAAAGLPGDGRTDLRDRPFVTIDPPASMDLDQAMLLERRGEGFRVNYAIADVSAIVPAGGAIEREAWTRGLTVYCPDERVMLYPQRICEDAASLLPDRDRAALVYVIDLDGDGRQTTRR
jgi:exoribonuclease R